MYPCKYFDCGWCYAPDNVKTNAIGKPSGCVDPNSCPYLKSQMTIKLKDYVNKDVIVTFRNGHTSVGPLSYTEIYCEYKYGFGPRWYDRDGKVLIDQEHPFDIVSIITVEENDKNFENSKQIVNEAFSKNKTMDEKHTPLPDIIEIDGVKYQKVEEPLPAKDKVPLYHRLTSKGSWLNTPSDNCQIVREFLLDEGVIECEDEEYITITLQKSLLNDPHADLPYFVGN